MIACTAIFVVQQFAFLPGVFALWPIGAGFEPWQLVTYAFLHGSLMHVGFNMLAAGPDHTLLTAGMRGIIASVEDT